MSPAEASDPKGYKELLELRTQLKEQRVARKASLKKIKATVFRAVECERRGTLIVDLDELKRHLDEDDVDDTEVSSDSG